MRRSLERWEKIRALGKTRFVFGSALAYGLTVAGIADVLDSVFYGGSKYSLLSNTILYSIIAIVLGHVTWWDMEGKYQAALIDARRKATGESFPHNTTSDSFKQ